MKVVAVIEEFNGIREDHRIFLENVRRQTGADYIIAIMSGDFLQQGLPALEDKYIRAAQAVGAGADLIIELPVYCSLASPDTYAYAAVSMLESLHCVDELCIACHTDRPELLPQIARLLFMETYGYQNEIRRLRSRGMSFYDAQAAAMEQRLPGAGAVLKDPVNMFAVEYARALKRLYSTIRPVFVHAEFLSPLHSTRCLRDNTDMSGTDAAAGVCIPRPHAVSTGMGCAGDPGISNGVSTYLDTLLKYELQFSERKLDDVYGATAMLTEQLRALKGTFTGFEKFARQLATPTRSPANIRRYLLSFILNIRKSDMAICRLYSFAPYANILYCAPGAQLLIKLMRENAWLPLLAITGDSGHSDMQAAGAGDFPAQAADTNSTPAQCRRQPDEARRMLTSLDIRAHKLYQLAYPSHASRSFTAF